MENNTEFFLKLVDVRKNFRFAGEDLIILKGINLEIMAGETIAITGSSGSGKSTLLGLMAGLDRVSSGTIFVEDVAIENWSEERLAFWRRSDVGFVFQDFRLVPSFTARENVALPLEIAGKKTSIAYLRAAKLLEDLGLSERLNHFPHQLSGGEQQRVAIARAYAHSPRIIFADEPTGNLDPVTSEHVLESLFAMNRQHGTALVLVTHDLKIAGFMQRKVALRDGKNADG